MSVHPSLRSSKKGGANALRSVMKRYERIRHMMAQGTWEEGRSVLGLPKIKQARLKTRKTSGGKAKEAQTAKAASGASAETPAGSSSSRHESSTQRGPS